MGRETRDLRNTRLHCLVFAVQLNFSRKYLCLLKFINNENIAKKIKQRSSAETGPDDDRIDDLR